MATLAFVPVTEYLRTSYRPDCDYVDGDVQERNLGETSHSAIQLFLGSFFSFNKGLWGLRALTECRVQVSPTRFRVPDICVISLPARFESILTEPPLLCIEILSPEDTVTRTQSRFDDYLAMGVENIWLIDLIERRFWTVDADGLHPVKADAYTIAGTLVRIPLADIAAELDDLAAGR